MWLKTIQLKNIKSFADSSEIQLSKGINVLVGPNGSGKSAVLRSAYLLQGPQDNPNYSGQFLNETLRIGAESQEVKLLLADPSRKQLRCLRPEFDMQAWQPEFLFLRKQNQLSFLMRKNNPTTEFVGCELPICHQREPHNLIYPYFSRRKPSGFDPAINLQNETIVEETFTHLPAKIDRLSKPSHAGYKLFEENCANCLRLPISTATHAQGKEVGLMLADGTLLPVDKMGEGTPGILSLLSHLCIAKGKLFLIEELENDIHPKALKALLEFIISKSFENQFLISTHSNIVLKLLGGAPDAHVFSVEMNLGHADQVPTSTCTLLDAAPENRARLLEDLGYAPSDLYLYDAYLVLEESTAERIFRDFIVPHMFPRLVGRLRVVAAGGVSKVEPCFDDFHRLFVFLHVTPQYHSRAWVAVDADPQGNELMSKLKSRFHSWPPSRFRCFAATKFESYYPPQFKAEADRVLALQDKQSRQKGKGKLAESVAAWCRDNSREATEWFSQHAKDVLALLTEIDESLATPNHAEASALSPVQITATFPAIESDAQPSIVTPQPAR